MTVSESGLRTAPPAEMSQIPDAESDKRTAGDLASISDELTDALQAASCYVEAARLIATNRPPVLDKSGRDLLRLAADQIQRASRAVKNLHCTLTDTDCS